jgi:hypothetical protein
MEPRNRSRGMRRIVLLTVGLASLAVAASASAGRSEVRISTAGATLTVPAGWHAKVARSPRCDPKRLIILSSARLAVGTGRASRPADGEVVVVLLEDRLPIDRPAGDLRRPTSFSVSWDRLTRLDPPGFCGNPDAPAFMRWFGVGNRFLGYVVYPGRNTRASVRTATIALMDSLRVDR